MLTSDPLLVLFVVVALGAAIGRFRFRGIGLGPAAALFAGLGISAIEPDLADLPAIIPLFGLALFIYTVGLASGPAFFGGLRQDGVKVSAAVVALLTAIGFVVAGVSSLFGFDDGARAGLFAGSQTNTPALSAALELVEQSASSQHQDRLELTSQADLPGFVLRGRCDAAARGLQIERTFGLPDRTLASPDAEPRALRGGFVYGMV